jgi:hypothetical protein
LEGYKLPSSPGFFRYNRSNVKTIQWIVLSCVLLAPIGAVADASFRVKVPDLTGKETRAVLTFDDLDKKIEIRTARHQPVIIPYANVEKASYEYTHERSVALTEGKAHWLEIDYHEGDAHKQIVVRMSGGSHVKILDALKSHCGIDADIQGNADKRHH